MDRYNTGDMSVTYRRFIFLRRSFPSFAEQNNAVVRRDMHIAEHAFAGEIRQRGHHATLSALIRLTSSAHSENAHGAF